MFGHRAPLLVASPADRAHSREKFRHRLPAGGTSPRSLALKHRCRARQVVPIPDTGHGHKPLSLPEQRPDLVRFSFSAEERAQRISERTAAPVPNERAGDPGHGSVDGRHLLLVGAGPGLGTAVARRFAVGGYRVTLVARRPDGLGDLAGALADTGAQISTIAADASDPDGLGTRMRELYLRDGAPGVIVYNAVMGAPDRLLSSSVAHLQAAYSVDVISAIVVAQVAAPAMRAAGFGTILVTGGGFADHPIPALATVSLGKAALRSAATMLGADLEPDGIRVATLTIAGQIAAGTSFDPERIAERYWEVVHLDGPWQAEFRFTGE
jgi:short-subunit dehydrogenase